MEEAILSCWVLEGVICCMSEKSAGYVVHIFPCVLAIQRPVQNGNSTGSKMNCRWSLVETPGCCVQVPLQGLCHALLFSGFGEDWVALAHCRAWYAFSLEQINSCRKRVQNRQVLLSLPCRRHGRSTVTSRGISPSAGGENGWPRWYLHLLVL